MEHFSNYVTRNTTAMITLFKDPALFDFNNIAQT